MNDRGGRVQLDQLIVPDRSPQTIASARDAINHGCDGPITPFVLICRAMELAKGAAIHSPQ